MAKPVSSSLYGDWFITERRLVLIYITDYLGNCSDYRIGETRAEEANKKESKEIKNPP